MAAGAGAPGAASVAQGAGREARRRRIASAGCVALLSTAVALVGAEVAVRALGLDGDAVRGALAYQAADLAVHRVSEDPFLRYELAPGTAGTFPGGSGEGGEYTVHVNRQGARGREVDVAKTPGTYRVLCVGGSTMYGAGVEDDETIPAQLEAALARRLRGRPAGPGDRRAPGATPDRVEAWNFGLNGANTSQAVRLAAGKLDALAPDVVVIQLYNTGRRMVLGTPVETRAPSAYYEADPDFVRENFPSPGRAWRSAHEATFRHSALYRLVAATARARSATSLPDLDLSRARETAAFEEAARARGVPYLYVGIPACRDRSGSDALGSYLNLHQDGREEAYYLVHPPAPILAELAERIARALVARGWVAGLPATLAPGSAGGADGPSGACGGRFLGPSLAPALRDRLAAASPSVSVSSVEVDNDTARVGLCERATCGTLVLTDPTCPCATRPTGAWCTTWEGPPLTTDALGGVLAALGSMEPAWTSPTSLAQAEPDNPWPAPWSWLLPALIALLATAGVALAAASLWVVTAALRRR